MPSELRILRFGLNEIGETLRSLGSNIGLDVPDGDFISAVTGSGEQASDISFATSRPHESVTISNNKLAACLIHRCKTLKIPLPRAGKKEIYISSQFVELRVGLRYKPKLVEEGKEVELEA